VSYAGTKWLHCTIDSELLSAKARDTNGADSTGAAPALARVTPVFFKNRRRVTECFWLFPPGFIAHLLISMRFCVGDALLGVSKPADPTTAF
jgi:hypothetical protein